MNNKGGVASGMMGLILAVVAQFDIESALRILVLVLSLIATIISLIFSVYKWYKYATDIKGDGGKQITSEELEKGVKIATDGLTKAQDAVTKIDEVVKEDKKDADKH